MACKIYDETNLYVYNFHYVITKAAHKIIKIPRTVDWNEVESQLSEKMTTEPIKRDSRYVNGKLKTWKERIKTDFRGQDVPYNIHCNATAVLKIDSIYKQGKNYHPQVYVEECKYADAANQQHSMFSDDDDDD